MAEHKEEEWLGEPMPHLPGAYIQDEPEQGFHDPSYDVEVLALLAVSFILGFSLAYLLDRYRREREAPTNLVFV
ncbi:hypothetical protein HYW46_07270 [Candidatus Daviesbacteria bacterium]|nr:hypothetical protein [Candidatus Daviesbacteria bacterium]